jgi:V8-like Glu-specific endopeptidase
MVLMVQELRKNSPPFVASDPHSEAAFETNVEAPFSGPADTTGSIGSNAGETDPESEFEYSEQVQGETSLESIETDMENVVGYEYTPTTEAEGEEKEEENVVDIEFANEAPLTEALARTQMEAVLGTDERVKITNTTVTPWKQICSLKITTADGKKYIGSGSIISSRLILTAGHCVYIPRTKSYVKSIEVIPGRNGSSKPFRSHVATLFAASKGWKDSQKKEYDFGFVILPPKHGIDSARVGSMGVANTSNANVLGWTVNNSGYPGDRDGGQHQYFNAKKIVQADEKMIYYDLDTYGGQSGSPVWIYDPKSYQRLQIAIHAYGGQKSNSGPRINSAVFKTIQDFKTKYP